MKKHIKALFAPFIAAPMGILRLAMKPRTLGASMLLFAVLATTVIAADSLDTMLIKIFGTSKPPTAPPYALTAYSLVDKRNNVIAKTWNGSLDLSPSTNAVTLPKADLSIPVPANGGNLGASNSFTGVINSTLVTFGTMTNGAATAKTKTLMDDTPAAEFSAVTVGTAPTDTQDANIARKGTNSLKLAWPAASVAGDGVMWTAFSGEDWTTEESVGFWIYTDVALAAGDLTFVIVDSTADHAFDIPAVPVANKWTWVEIDISALATTDGDAVTNYKILASTAGAAKGVMNTYFDGGWKWDSTEELALGVDLVDSPGAVRKLLTLVKANTGTHDFVAIAEDTDFFVHSESGNDFLVTITDQSTKTAIGLVNHK